MTISTYTELQAAVLNWLDNPSGLDSRVIEWIDLGEKRINRDLGRIRTAWTSTTLTGTTSSRSVALPTGFIEARSLFLTTSGSQVELVPFINGTIELSTTNGTPKMWCISGANIDFDCPCDQAHTFLFHYRSKWDIASDSTNWLLTNHSDLYLSAALVHAYIFRENMEAATRWDGAYNLIKDAIEDQEARNLSIAPLQSEVAAMTRRGSFNYTLGE